MPLLRVHAARVVYSVLFYMLSMTLIMVSKPAAVFDEVTGKPLAFGLGEDKTLYSLGVVSVTLALVAFYMFALIDMVFS